MVKRNDSRTLLILALLGVSLFVAAILWPNKQRRVSLLVILDTVRADHTSVCGYARPTTPVLERLVAEGASVNCNAWMRLRRKASDSAASIAGTVQTAQTASLVKCH